jgi:hypothetical protein
MQASVNASKCESKRVQMQANVVVIRTYMSEGHRQAIITVTQLPPKLKGIVGNDNVKIVHIRIAIH